MKTETQIAQENVNKLIEREEKEIELAWRPLIKCKEHLASCRRFLEFLEGLGEDDNGADLNLYPNIEQKTKDLQNVIKTYEEAGVK